MFLLVTGCEVVPERVDPRLELVEPASWPVGDAPSLVIHGDQLYVVPVLNFRDEKPGTRDTFSATLGDQALGNVTWQSNDALTADAPPGLGVGIYDLVVTTPSGTTATLYDAVRVHARGAGGQSIPGSATISLTETFVEETFSPAVDPDKSVLFFNTTLESELPYDGQISGQLVDDNTVRFERNGVDSGPLPSGIEIRYTVLEHDDFFVQRGSHSRGSILDTIAFSAPVDLDRAFILASLRVNGDTYGANDWLHLRFADDSSFEIDAEFHDANPTVEWQVVQLASTNGAVVYSGEVQFSGTSTTVQIPTVELNRSLLMVSYQVTASIGVESTAVLSRFVGPDEIELERSAGGGSSVEATWFVLEWPVLTVHHGLTVFDVGEATLTEPLPCPRSHSAAVSFLPSVMRQGMAAETNDRIGVCWFTTELKNGDCSLRIHRGSTIAPAKAAWSVAWLP